MIFDRFKNKIRDEQSDDPGDEHLNSVTVYNSGLLRDIGMIIMDAYMEKYIEEIDALSVYDLINISKFEQRVIGIDHAFLGFKVLEKWNLPPVMTEGIRYHHDPYQQKKMNSISEILYINEKTVKNHLWKIYQKLEMKDLPWQLY